MAKVYKAFDAAPELDYSGDWQKQEQDYIEQQVQKCREASPGDALAGELVQFPVADGYARYLVVQSKPLSLIHLQLGDAYRLQSFAERGLALADIKRSVACRKQFEQLMAKRSA